MHTREDEVFMLIKGTALVWYGDDEPNELAEGGIVFPPKDVPHAYRITSDKADLLMINTPPGSRGCSDSQGATRRIPGRTVGRSRSIAWAKRPRTSAT
jgi:Cupin domain